jgi:hypothetical protein
MYQYVIRLNKKLWFVGYKDDLILSTDTVREAKKFKYKNWAKYQSKFIRQKSNYQKLKIQTIYEK